MLVLTNTHEPWATQLLGGIEPLHPVFVSFKVPVVLQADNDILGLPTILHLIIKDCVVDASRIYRIEAGILQFELDVLRVLALWWFRKCPRGDFFCHLVKVTKIFADAWWSWFDFEAKVVVTIDAVPFFVNHWDSKTLVSRVNVMKHLFTLCTAYSFRDLSKNLDWFLCKRGMESDR